MAKTKTSDVMLIVIAVLSLFAVCLIFMLNYSYDESQARTAGAFHSACELVPVHVKNNNLFIFALRPQDQYATTMGGYNIRLIVNDEIIKTHVDSSGTYPAHHNGVMLSYATDQYCHGNRNLGNLLLELLHRADPTIKVYYRDEEKEKTRVYLPSMPIGEILKIAKNEPAKAKTLLAHEANQWEWRKEIGLQNIPQAQSAPAH
jgi:hypothetical protein